MNGRGQHPKVKRLSEEEVYADARRILEELLQKNLSGEAHVRPLHKRRTPRPQRPIQENDESLAEKRPVRGADDDDLQNIHDHGEHIKAVSDHLQDDYLATAADTEDDSSPVSDKRHKKSVFQRAKDRLRHAFHRDQRESKNKTKNGATTSTSASELDMNEYRKGSVRSDKSKNGVLSSGDRERRHSGGLFKTLRRSFSSRKEDKHSRAYFQNDSSSREASQKSVIPFGPSKSAQPASSSSTPDDVSPALALSVPDSERKGSVSPFPNSTSTDSKLDSRGANSSSLHSFSSTRTKSVLDDPGEEIEFIDEAEGDAKSLPRTEGGDAGPGKIVASTSRRQPGLYKQSSLCVDGSGDEVDGHDGNGHEGNSGGVPLHERSPLEKNRTYEQIAKKLIHIADNYVGEGGVSDAEAPTREPPVAGAARQISRESLTELEREIIECLRDTGDRNSSIMDGPAEQAVQQARTQIYERFKSTLRHAMGDEVSWNQVAFLFYTTKGVVSAVGKGTRMANDAKEMTLQYISDKFASWIIDQGGFDPVLSDSDPDVD